MIRLASISIIALTVAASPVSQAHADRGSCYEVREINVTDNGTDLFTSWFGINNQRQVVGNYCIDPFCALMPDGNIVGGAIIDTRNGKQETFTLPAPYNWVGGVEINERGIVVGEALISDTSGGVAGAFTAGVPFVRDRRGNLSILPLPVANAVFSAARDINNRGEIVGGFTDSTGRERGIIWNKNGQPRIYDATATGSTVLQGINDAGTMTGFVVDAVGIDGFVDDGSGPVFFGNGSGRLTFFQGIQQAGRVVGYSRPQSNTSIIEPFIFDGGNFEALTYPDSANTRIHSINNAGYIAGTDASFSFGRVLVPIDCDD